MFASSSRRSGTPMYVIRPYRVAHHRLAPLWWQCPVHGEDAVGVEVPEHVEQQSERLPRRRSSRPRTRMSRSSSLAPITIAASSRCRAPGGTSSARACSARVRRSRRNSGRRARRASRRALREPTRRKCSDAGICGRLQLSLAHFQSRRAMPLQVVEPGNGVIGLRQRNREARLVLDDACLHERWHRRR